jgi:hypothetical protein
MSFGCSPSDFVLIIQLASNAVQNARKACGAHDGLTREVTCLHVALQRLKNEASNPQSLLNSTGDDRKDELATLIQDCGGVLRVLTQILEKYNALSEEKRSVTELWQKVRFGNGEMQDLSRIRLQLMTYTSAITIFINTLSLGSQGRVEEYMAIQGGELQRMRRSLNWIIASLQASCGNTESSILTSYTDDDKAIWKDFRRELIREGYSTSFLKKHRETIQNYVRELGQRGALDEPTRDERETVDEAQIYEGARISRKDPEMTAEHRVSLSRLSISAAGEIPAEDKEGRYESDYSDEAGSVELHPTWSSCSVDEEFNNRLSGMQFPLKEPESMVRWKDECGVESVKIAASSQGGLGRKVPGGLTRHKSPSITTSEDTEEPDYSGMFYDLSPTMNAF